MRLFVSVDLPDDLAPAVEAVQREFDDAAGLSFTDPEQAHVTMKFLGDVPADEVSAIEDALDRAVAAADLDPFEADVEGLGVFPNLEYITVIWAGVGRGTEELTRLHEAVEQRTVDLGFDPEDHAFTPHVTLARMQHAGSKELVQEVVEETHPEIGTMRVEELRLTESELTPEGPAYSTVYAAAL